MYYKLSNINNNNNKSSCCQSAYCLLLSVVDVTTNLVQLETCVTYGLKAILMCYGIWLQINNQRASPPVSRNSGIQTAISYAREGLFSKACQALLSSGLAPNNQATWNLLVSKHPKIPLPSPPSTPSAPLLLPPDFDFKAILHSFPKGTACGPSGLRIQHLIEVAGIPMQSSICAALRDIVNLLLSGKVSVSVTKFMAGGSLVALEKNKPNCLLDVRPIAVGETLRRLASKCICAIVKNKASEFFSHFQLGVACPSGSRKNHSCMA